MKWKGIDNPSRAGFLPLLLLLLLLFLFTLQLPFTPIRPSSVHARIVIVKCSPKVKTTFWPFLPFTPGTNGRSSSLFPPIPFRISFPANSICCLSRCHYSTALESGRSCARLVFVPNNNNNINTSPCHTTTTGGVIDRAKWGDGCGSSGVVSPWNTVGKLLPDIRSLVRWWSSRAWCCLPIGVSLSCIAPHQHQCMEYSPHSHRITLL